MIHQGNRLTNDHRRLLGTAIAMAQADGVLDEREEALIDYLCDELRLSSEAREEISAMVRNPPTPEQIASWNVTNQDRRNVYALAIRMAKADGLVDPAELAMLDRLAEVLGLAEDDKAEAERLVEDVA